MKKILKRLTAIILSLAIVFGVVGAQTKEVKAADNRVGTSYYQITYYWSKYDKKKVKVPVESLKKYTVYKVGNKYYVYNGKAKGSGKKRYYYMQEVRKKGVIYVIDYYLMYNKQKWIKKGTFKTYKNKYVLGSGFKGAKNYNKNSYTWNYKENCFKWDVVDPSYGEIISVSKKWQLGYIAS